MGTGGKTSSDDIWGQDLTGGAYMGDNVPHPKREGGYHGIGIFEVAWKVCTAVVHCRLKRNVVLHDALHGFKEGQGMGKANL